MPEVKYSVTAQWEGPRLNRSMKAGARKGVRRGAEYLKSLSVPLAPLDLGPLRASASVRLINAEPVAYLIFDTPYAAIQHEDESFQHDDGQAKYVEEPMTKHAHEIQGMIAKEVHLAIVNA